MGLLNGKKALIFGVANDRSIAWGIAKALHEEGCELAFTYLGETLEKRLRPLAESVGSTLLLPCDASKDYQIEALYSECAAVGQVRHPRPLHRLLRQERDGAGLRVP
jgi:enoyl-[acyl-carrier protein] reductase I